MSDPISFEYATARFALPLLFAGQSQKEVLVNEALVLADALLHCTVEARTSSPPSIPQDGQAWIVGASAAGEWSGRDGDIAYRSSEQWIFLGARDGMRAHNRATGQDWRRVNGAWSAPIAPAPPSGGATVDGQARTAIVNLLQSLKDAGVLS